MAQTRLPKIQFQISCESTILSCCKTKTPGKFPDREVNIGGTFVYSSVLCSSAGSSVASPFKGSTLPDALFFLEGLLSGASSRFFLYELKVLPFLLRSPNPLNVSSCLGVVTNSSSAQARFPKISSKSSLKMTSFSNNLSASNVSLSLFSLKNLECSLVLDLDHFAHLFINDTRCIFRIRFGKHFTSLRIVEGNIPQTFVESVD